MLSRPTSPQSRLDRGKMDKAGYQNLRRYTSNTVTRIACLYFYSSSENQINKYKSYIYYKLNKKNDISAIPMSDLFKCGIT